MEKLALTKQFIKEYKEQDLAFGGKLNLCDLNIIKSYLGFYFIAHGFFGGVDGGGVKTMVQNYFRNRRYEVIFSLKRQGKDVCQICGITGLRDGQVRKCFKTPENQIEIYKIFESEWQGKPKEEITMKKPMKTETKKKTNISDESENHYVPEIKNVIFNYPSTTVLWSDGTKTVVKCQKGDKYSMETGLALCIAKKALGNNSDFNDIFKKWIDEPKEKDIEYFERLIEQLTKGIRFI